MPQSFGSPPAEPTELTASLSLKRSRLSVTNLADFLEARFWILPVLPTNLAVGPSQASFHPIKPAAYIKWLDVC